MEDETVANAELEPSPKIGARHTRQAPSQIFVDAVCHFLEVALAERTFFAFFRKEDEEVSP